jgi:hypothetical protein
MWLVDCEIAKGDSGASLEQLQRFASSENQPEFKKEFFAVAVVDAEFLEEEMEKSLWEPPDAPDILVFSIPNLKLRYEEAYQRALQEDEA